MARTRRWLMRDPPQDDRPLLFGFPYAGVGAGAYRRWPAIVGGFWLCPLQPPGRESRFGEPPLRTHREWGADFADFAAPYTERPYAFIGHCGAVPLALSSLLAIQDLGLPLPLRLFASAWGPPHRGLYGPLNFVDLEAVDLKVEVRRLFRGLGAPIREDFVEIAAEALRIDLELQRPYRYDASRRVPCPVTVVGWLKDTVVPPETVCRHWAQCAEVSYALLDGGHFSYMDCPPGLAALVARALPAGSVDMSRRPGGRLRPASQASSSPLYGTFARGGHPANFLDGE